MTRTDDCRVQVYFRARGPPERAGEESRCVTFQSDKRIGIRVPNRKSSKDDDVKEYEFAHVFREEASQQELYDVIGRDIICKANLQSNSESGRDVCLIAYGQTGSGKTYSMRGRSTTGEDQGIIPRLVNDLFDTLPRESKVEVQYVELYNNKLRDLLNPSNIKVKPSLHGLVNATSVIVKNLDDFKIIYGKGDKARTVDSHSRNADSSRSHAICTLLINLKTHTRRIHLVDLAGYESARMTGAQSRTAYDGGKIALELGYLNDLVKALQPGGTKSHMVTLFRQSKLNFVLKPMLGGNSITRVLLAASTLTEDATYTQKTLFFGKSIRTVQVSKLQHDQRQNSERLHNAGSLDLAQYIAHVSDVSDILMVLQPLINHSVEIGNLQHATLEEILQQIKKLNEVESQRQAAIQEADIAKKEVLRLHAEIEKIGKEGEEAANDESEQAALSRAVHLTVLLERLDEYNQKLHEKSTEAINKTKELDDLLHQHTAASSVSSDSYQAAVSKAKELSSQSIEKQEKAVQCVQTESDAWVSHKLPDSVKSMTTLTNDPQSSINIESASSVKDFCSLLQRAVEARISMQDARGQVDMLKLRIKEQDQERQRLEEELKRLQYNHKLEIDDLNQTINDFENDWSESQQLQEQILRQQSTLTDASGDSTMSKADLIYEVECLGQEIQELKEANEELEERNKQLEEDAWYLECERDEQLEESEIARAEVEKLQQESDYWRQKSTNQTGGHNELRDDRDRLSRRAMELDSQLMEATAQLRKAEENLGAVKEELSTANMEKATATEAVDNLTDHAKRLDERLQAAEKDKDAAEKLAKHMEQRWENGKNEIWNLQKALQKCEKDNQTMEHKLQNIEDENTQMLDAEIESGHNINDWLPMTNSEGDLNQEPQAAWIGQIEISMSELRTLLHRQNINHADSQQFSCDIKENSKALLDMYIFEHMLLEQRVGALERQLQNCHESYNAHSGQEYLPSDRNIHQSSLAQMKEQYEVHIKLLHDIIAGVGQQKEEEKDLCGQSLWSQLQSICTESEALLQNLKLSGFEDLADIDIAFDQNGRQSEQAVTGTGSNTLHDYNRNRMPMALEQVVQLLMSANKKIANLEDVVKGHEMLNSVEKETEELLDALNRLSNAEDPQPREEFAKLMSSKSNLSLSGTPDIESFISMSQRLKFALKEISRLSEQQSTSSNLLKDFARRYHTHHDTLNNLVSDLGGLIAQNQNTSQDSSIMDIVQELQRKLNVKPEPPDMSDQDIQAFDIRLNDHMRDREQELERLQALLRIREDWRKNIETIKRYVTVVTHTCNEPDCEKWFDLLQNNRAQVRQKEKALDDLLEKQYQWLSSKGEDAAQIVDELRQMLKPYNIDDNTSGGNSERWRKLMSSNAKANNQIEQLINQVTSEKPRNQVEPEIMSRAHCFGLFGCLSNNATVVPIGNEEQPSSMSVPGEDLLRRAQEELENSSKIHEDLMREAGIELPHPHRLGAEQLGLQLA